MGNTPGFIPDSPTPPPAAATPQNPPGFIPDTQAQAPQMTDAGTGSFNDAVQRFTTGFVDKSGLGSVAKSLDSGVSGLISAAKQKFADAQAGRDEESQMAKAVTDSVKQGNYGQAAELLLGHIAKTVSPAVPIAQDLDRTAFAAAKDAGAGNYAGAAGDVVGGVGKYAPALLAPEAEGAIEGAPEAAGDAISSVKGVASRIYNGEAVAQPIAKSALSTAAKGAADEAGAAESTAGVRTLADPTIKALGDTERATYDAVNKAAGVDLKTLYDHAEEVQDALDDPTNISQKTALQQDLQTTQEQIAQGEAQAAKNGVDPADIQKAQALTQKRYAMQTVKQKLFNNEAVVKGNSAYGTEESLDVNSAIRQAENLNKPSRFAPEGSPTRLQQALGEDGANKLLKALYDAQKAGKQAIGTQQLAKTVGKWLGGLATGAGVIHAVN